MAGTAISYGVSTRKVRVLSSGTPVSTGLSSLAAGQANGAGAGTAAPSTPVLDLWFATHYNVNRTFIPGSLAIMGDKLDLMARIETQPAEVRFLFGDSVEATDNSTQFALLQQAADLPAVLVPADGTRWTVVARGLYIGFARFFFPQLVNVGGGASGAWRLCFRIY